MNTNQGNTDVPLFKFLSTKEETKSASLGPITGWVNGPLAVTELLNLYQVYKEECCHHLDGHSSFVLYDAEANRVIAARDFFGVYPIYYTQSSSQLVLSFSVKAIVESDGFTPRINRSMVAEYLNAESSTEPISDQTFYQDLYSLLPGHSLVSTKGQLTITPYGQLNPDRYRSLTDEEYIRCFRDFFVRSVNRVTDTHKKIASHLSGGLDSSSVCSVAQSLAQSPIHSFYIDTNTPAAQEEVYVNALLDSWRRRERPLAHQTVQPDLNGYDSVRKSTAWVGQPSQLLLPVSTFLPIIEKARQEGNTILLSGHGGDQVVGYGFEYLDELFRNQDWKALKIAFGQFADKRPLLSLSTKKTFKTAQAKRRAYAVYFFTKRIRQLRNPIRILQGSVALFTQFGCGPGDLFNFLYTRRKRTKEPSVPALKNWLRADWIATNPKAAVQVLDSSQLASGTLTDLQKEQVSFFYSSLGIQYNEEIAQLHGAYGLETAHPFLDKNLLEFTLNTSSRLRFGEGLGRNVLRQALSDYLPDMITSRADKGEFSEYTQEAFRTLYTEFTKQTDDNHPVWSIVNKATFDEAVGIIFDEKYTIKQKNPYRFVASRVIYLAIWLDYVNTISA